MKLTSRYEILARVFPAVLTGIPFYVLYYFLVSPQLASFVEALVSFKVVSDVTVGAAILFLAMQINRHISKEFYEKRLFVDELHLPTTGCLLHADEFFTSDVKKRLHDKILVDFGISIPDARSESEDEIRSRRTIVECVSQIRLRVGKGTLTYQHNIEYGFIRNLVGGSVISALVSAIAVTVFVWVTPNVLAAWISVVLLVFYVLVLIFGDHLIRSRGENYCRVLLREYLAS